MSPGKLVEMSVHYEPTTGEKMRAQTSQRRPARAGSDKQVVVVEAKRICDDQEADATPKVLTDSTQASWKLDEIMKRGGRNWLRNPWIGWAFPGLTKIRLLLPVAWSWREKSNPALAKWRAWPMILQTWAGSLWNEHSPYLKFLKARRCEDGYISGGSISSRSGEPFWCCIHEFEFAKIIIGAALFWPWDTSKRNFSWNCEGCVLRPFSFYIRNVDYVILTRSQLWWPCISKGELRGPLPGMQSCLRDADGAPKRCGVWNNSRIKFKLSSYSKHSPDRDSASLTSPSSTLVFVNTDRLLNLLYCLASGPLHKLFPLLNCPPLLMVLKTPIYSSCLSLNLPLPKRLPISPQSGFVALSVNSMASWVYPSRSAYQTIFNVCWLIHTLP